MNIAAKPLDEITATDIEALDPSADPLHLQALDGWSSGGTAIAISALANAGGGLAVVRGAPGQDELLAAATSLGPAGQHLVRARVIESGGKRTGLLSVAEAPSLPVMVETTGTIYRQTAAGATQVLTRGSLDELITKDRLNRQRAETNAESMIGRVAFGHFNYMTLAVVAAPRVNTPEPYKWANENREAILRAVAAFPGNWGLGEADFTVEPGEITLGRKDETAFVRISRNGTVAVGERRHRPAQGIYIAPGELAQFVSAMAGLASLPFRAVPGTLVLGSFYVEGVRELRLPVEGGATAPVPKDLLQRPIAERYLASQSECEAFEHDLLQAAGEIFNAGLVSGTAEAYTGAIKEGPDPKIWHGLTKRTERRLAGLRSHGTGH